MERGRALRQWASVDLRWLLLLGLLTAVVLKVIVVLDPSLGRLNADHAVLYLMARHVPDGELPVWYWGQEYGGSLLPLLLGAVFVVTGPQLWLLPVAIALVSTAVPVLTWRVGVALGVPSAGAVAGALVAVGPPTWLFFGVVSDGFYAVGMALSLLSLLLALRSAPLGIGRAAVIGLLVGAALWTSPFSYLTTLPTAVVLLPRLAKRWVLVAPLALGVAGGALPVIVTAVRRGSLLPPQFTNDSTIGDRVEAAVTGAWSALFTRFGPEQAPAWLVDRVAVVALLVVVLAGLAAVIRLRRDRADLTTVALLLPVLLWVPFHVRAYLPADPPASRYAVPLLPFLALWASRLLRTPRQGIVAVAGLALYSAVGLWQAGVGPAGDALHSRSYAALAEDLERNGRTAVYADYWVSYRLVAETDERIVAHPPSLPRRAAYERAAREAPRTTVVVFADQPTDQALQAFFAADSGVVRVVLEQFAIYYADRQVTLPGMGGTVDIDRL